MAPGGGVGDADDLVAVPDPLKAGLATLATGALLAAPLSVASAGQPDRDRGRPLEVVGLVDGTSLVEFRTNNTRTRADVEISGLDGDDSLVGIDHRVQDGKLYGVGDNGGGYTIDDDGRATKGPRPHRGTRR